MYKTVLIGLVALATVCAAQGSKCPAEDPKDTSVMLPYPDDCTKFYLCAHGVAVPMNCPWGTYFNANKSICDWPQNSGCVQPNPPTVCNPADLVPLYPVPNNCSAFISCVGSQQIQMACPEGLYFSSSLKVCVWPKDSGCVQASTTTSSNDLTNQPSSSSSPLPPKITTAQQTVKPTAVSTTKRSWWPSLF